MPIYLFMQGAPGDVQATGYVNWIDVNFVGWTSFRPVNTKQGSTENRESGAVTINQVVLKKHYDPASAKIHDFFFKAQAFQGMTTKIAWTRTGDKSGYFPQRVITLQDVIIASYQWKGQGDSPPEETVFLNYTLIQFQDYTAEAPNTLGTASISGYNLVNPAPL